MAKTELTADDVLKMFGLKYPEYKAEKKYNTAAAQKESKKHNAQLYEWVILKKEGKDTYKQVDGSLLISKGGTVLNACAVKGDNGIIIYKPMQLLNDVKKTGGVLKGINDTNAGDSNESESFMNMGMQYEPSGFVGKDEELIQIMAFTKKCLIKECYEFLGEVF